MNKEQFEQLPQSLHDHHIKGIGNSYTAAPIYLARVKKIDWGYEEEFAQHHCIYYDCEEYHTMESFIESFDLDDDDEEELDYFLEGVSQHAKDYFKKEFKTWELGDLFHFMECYMEGHEFQYLHGNERWETVNWFITREEAENFVISKGADPDFNVWVDSLYRSSEFRGLLEAIANGKLEWKE